MPSVHDKLKWQHTRKTCGNAPQLHCHIPQWQHCLWSNWHGTLCTFRWGLPQQKSILQQSRCTYLPLGRQSNTTLQQRGPYNSNHYQVCHGLGCWGWACCTLYCHPQNGPPPANPQWHGVTATTKPYPNRQLNQDHCSKTVQNDGHETMVVKKLRLTKSIPILLGCRLEKFCWLQHQTPSRYIP